MYIFTDSPNSTNLLLPGDHRWQIPHAGEYFNHDYLQLVSKLLKKPSFLKMDTEPEWHSLIHTEHSPFSQFDVLTKITNNGCDLPDGILCHADSGHNFHGQKNRSWEAKKGNIHLSVFLTPNIFPEGMNSKFLTMGVSSVIETIDSFPELKGKAMIKWPNDIFIGQSKVGGILTQCFSSENKIRAVVLGIGLNVETPPKISGDKFTPQAGSLKDYSKSINFKNVFLTLLKSLFTCYRLVKKNHNKHHYDLYNKRSMIIGKNCAVYITDEIKPDIKGKVTGLGDDLELIFENNPQPIRSGRLEILDY